MQTNARAAASALTNLGDLPARAARMTPEREALVWSDGRREQRLTYGAVETRLERIASALQAHGVGIGSRVAIAVGNRLEFVELVFGSQRAGAIAAPIPLGHGPQRIAALLAELAPTCVFVDSEALEWNEMLTNALPRNCFVIDLARASQYAKFVAAGTPFRVRPALDPSSPAMIVYTSGSSGDPLGVIVTHAAQLASRRSGLDEELGGLADPPGRALIASPLAHKNALLVGLKTMLQSGGASVILPRFAAETCLWALAHYRCTYTSLLPSMCERLLVARQSRPDLKLPALRAILVASAPAQVSLFDRLATAFGCEVFNAYGLTEAGPAFGQAAGRAPRGSIGQPIPGVEVKLLNEAGSEDAECGELWVRSPYLAAGYWRRPAATRARFVDGWLRTLDRVRRDAAGFYYFEGRTDQAFKHRGYLVEPRVIEASLRAHPLVEDASAVPLPCAGDLVPVAFVRLRAALADAPMELQRWCAERLPPHAVPLHIAFVDELPTLPSGKVDRRALAPLAADNLMATS
jgi:long-chain acyl-CoA synthetase